MFIVEDGGSRQTFPFRFLMPNAVVGGFDFTIICPRFPFAKFFDPGREMMTGWKVRLDNDSDFGIALVETRRLKGQSA
jgi:hypothetical protein